MADFETNLKAEAEERLKREAGERLSWVRALAGPKQDELATSLGITQGEWSRWEKGKRMPPPHIMTEVCARLRISMDYIYRGLLVGVHPDLAAELLKRHPEQLTPPPMYTGWGKGKDQP